MISQPLESLIRRVRAGDALTMSLGQTAALRRHLEAFIQESDLGELSQLLSCYPTRGAVVEALESMISEAERSIRALYASGRCKDMGEDGPLM